MSKKFKTYDPRQPLPFILLFEEPPDEESAMDGTSIRRYQDDFLHGIEHKAGLVQPCFCEMGGIENHD